MFRKKLGFAALALQAHGSRRAAWQAYRTLVRLDRFAQRTDQRIGEELQVTMDGLELHGFGYRQLLHLYKEIFLKKDYAVTLDRSDPVIIDCGSNIGASISFFKKSYPKARVIGFEPHPKLFPVLRANLDRNGMRDVELHNCALGKENGTVAFFVSENPGYLRSSVRADRGGEVRIECRLERLSDHLRSLDRIDLVKVDVEGAEHLIVADLLAAGLLAKPEQYIFEYHLNLGSDRSDLSRTLRIFEENGYDYNLHAERPHGRRFQDVLIHCYRTKAPA